MNIKIKKNVLFILCYGILGSFSMYSFRALSNSMSSKYNPIVLKSNFFVKNDMFYYIDKTIVDFNETIYVNEITKDVLFPTEYKKLVTYDIFKYLIMSLIIVIVTIVNPIFKLSFLPSFFEMDLNEDMTRKELIVVICGLLLINYPVFFF